MKYRNTRPTKAPIQGWELDAIARELTIRSTRKVAAALHLLAMGRCGWRYTTVANFCRWIKCDPGKLPGYLTLADCIGASGQVVGQLVIAKQIARATPPFYAVKLPVPVGDKQKLIRHLKRIKA